MRGCVTAALVALLAGAPACKQTAGEVDITILADDTISDAARAAITSLRVVVSGAASADRVYPVDHPFAAGARPRLVIKPPVSSGSLTIAISASDASLGGIGYGETSVPLRSSAVPAQLTLSAGTTPPPDLGTNDAKDAGTGTDGSTSVPVLSLLAGNLGGIGFVDGAGQAARFNRLRGAAYYDGSVYLSDMKNHLIRQLSLTTGVVTTLAGQTMWADAVDGIGTAARFYRPNGICSDGAGTLYVADMLNHTIRKVVIATGAVTTLAGSAGQHGSTNDIGAAARFDHPHGLACDGAGNLYVADTFNHSIRKVVIATGAVTTLAGGLGGYVDATGTSARFNQPHGLAFANGNVYVADRTNHVIRRIVASSGVVTTLAGTGTVNGYADGIGSAARFFVPMGIVADGAGTLYVADSGNNRMRQVVEATGAVTTIAGQSTPGSVDGVGASASFANPYSLALDGAGNLYGVDGDRDILRKVVIASATVTTVTGSPGGEGMADGVGTSAAFRRPHGLWVEGNTLFVADKSNNAIRTIDLSSGVVATLAGDGTKGSNDGVGSAARFDGPFGLVTDGLGNLYVADNNNTIRVIDIASRTVTTVAGQAGKPGSVDAVGRFSRFKYPAGVAYHSGALYVADKGNHTIRKLVVATGAVTTIAGTAGQAGSDDGVGTAALFNAPRALAVDSGTLYIADANNSSIRALALATGVVTTLAGTVGSQGNVDGIGAAARFTTPQGLIADGRGNLVVGDATSQTLRKLVIATGAVTTWVGQPGIAAVKLGPLPAGLNTPSGLALGPGGAIYIAATHENAILVLQ